MTLPDEILEQILNGALSGHRDTKTMSLVCRKFRRVMLSDQTWRRLCVRGWGHRSDIVTLALRKEASMSWLQYYKDRLLCSAPTGRYLIKQHQITASLRSILVNWMFHFLDQLSDTYPDSVRSEAVLIFDIYCGTRLTDISPNEFKRLATACGVIAM